MNREDAKIAKDTTTIDIELGTRRPDVLVNPDVPLTKNRIIRLVNE